MSVARSLTKKILTKRLAACVSTLPRLSSSYRWKGKIESAMENMLLIKTRRSNVSALTSLIVKNHPYDIPEVIAMPISSGHLPYLQWLRSETTFR